MKKIFMLSVANIRKNKGHTVSLLMMFIISAMLFNIGLLVFANFGSYFEKMTKELNASDVYYIMPSRLYSDSIKDYVENNDNILEKQTEETIWASGTIPYNSDSREMSFIMNDINTARTLSKWKFIGKHLPADSMSIYVPYVLSIDGGYHLNDQLKVKIKDTELTFTIKGFTEDTFFSSLDLGILGLYLPHETYEAVSQKLGTEYDSTLIYANLAKKNKDVETGIRDLLKKKNTYASADITSSFFSLNLDIAKLSRSFMASIIAIMTMAFAAIIAIVCLIVVRFRIVNSIEEDMTKIGSLKAVGYTSKQIISSIVTQFSVIAIAGSIAGISLSYLTTPLLSDVFAHQSGIQWVQGFDADISGISLGVILSVVLMVSFLASARIRKLHPIVALRGGIITHSFRKNHLPLHKSIGNLPVVLALKSILQNVKQSIMIAFIFVTVSFATTFAFVMFYNTVIDTKAFAETPGIEISNAIAVVNPLADNSNLVDRITKLEEVRKVQYIDTAMVNIDNNDVPSYVMDDYTQKETNTVYEGRYPLHSNEVVIAGQYAQMIGKSVGDSVTIKIGESKAEFVVTGLSQGSNMGGSNASLRRDGILMLNPDFKQQSLQIYLDKGCKADVFVEKIETLYGDSILATVDMDKSMEQGMGVYTSIVSKVGITMMAVTAMVVILVLYFVINSSVIRRKRELGIQKAIGFSNLQLMNQLSLGFLAPVIFGVAIGCALGILESNPIMSVAQRAMGIMKAHYMITLNWVALCGVIIVVISYLTSMLITFRIRKISAYALVSE